MEGEKVPFKVSGTTWAGVDIDEGYAMADVLSRYTRAELDTTFLYVEPKLKEALKPYEVDMGLSAVHRISPKVLYGSFAEEYNVMLVTDMYVYYVCGGDEFLMVETATGEVVADNYFAEVGYCESEENVISGEEFLLFQEYEFCIEAYIKNTLSMVRENGMSEFKYQCLYGEYGECETILLEGVVKNTLASFKVEKVKSSGQVYSTILVQDMPLTDECISRIAEKVKEIT